MLLLQHAPFDEHGDVAEAHAVDKRPDEHPPLPQVPGEEVHTPPPELLAEVVRVARVPPQSVLEGGDCRFAQLLQFFVPGHELVQLGVSKIGDHDSGDADNCRYEVPDAQWLIAGVNGVHWQAYANQKHLHPTNMPLLSIRRNKFMTTMNFDPADLYSKNSSRVFL